jgi:hypothetical protein
MLTSTKITVATKTIEVGMESMLFQTSVELIGEEW